MSSNGKTEDSPADELANLNRLVHDLYVRNKNQHRRSHWWKHFSIFRRQLRCLTTIKIFHQSSSAAQSSTTNERVSLTFNGEKRVEVWTTDFINSWHSAFMQLLSERRYASLGVIMLAVLARVCMLVGATDKLMEAGQHVLASQIQMHGSVAQALKPQEKTTEMDWKDPYTSPGTDELGEIVSRDQLEVKTVHQNVSEHVEHVTISATSLHENRGSKTKDRMAEAARRKKKVAKNEIGAIFAAFGT